jgi:hypothetical protein
MNTFHDLFRQPTRRGGNGPPPDRRSELFPGFVERSPKLHLWASDQPTLAQGPRLLIGVATWSGYDMNLLDLIEEAPDNGVRVEVLDVDSVSSPGELARLFPGAALLQTPFVGYWTDGKLIESASGFAGRQLVARVCGLDATEVEERMKSVTSRV